MPTGTPDYSKACIYKIWSPLTDRIYIGSTCDMTKRWCSHKSSYKKWKEGKCGLVTAYLLFDLVGLENCKMEWVKDFPCETKKQLNKEEGREQRQNKDLMVNILIAGRSKGELYQEHREEITIKSKEYRQQHKEELNIKAKEYQRQHREEKKEYQKEYYDTHKEQLSIKSKEYRNSIKEEIKIKKKEYYENHKEEIKKYRNSLKEEIKIKKKEYYENHKEEIKIKRSQKITCECGKPYILKHKARHIKSQKHQDFIKLQ